jgi:hypothetical protein
MSFQKLFCEYANVPQYSVALDNYKLYSVRRLVVERFLVLFHENDQDLVEEAQRDLGYMKTLNQDHFLVYHLPSGEYLKFDTRGELVDADVYTTEEEAARAAAKYYKS